MQHLTTQVACAKSATVGLQQKGQTELDEADRQLERFKQECAAVKVLSQTHDHWACNEISAYKNLLDSFHVLTWSQHLCVLILQMDWVPNVPCILLSCANSRLMTVMSVRRHECSPWSQPHTCLELHTVQHLQSSIGLLQIGQAEAAAAAVSTSGHPRSCSGQQQG